MRERVLAIMTLIAQYVMENRDPSAEVDIVEELLASGFEEEEIDAAFTWMETISQSLRPRAQLEESFVVPPQRIYTPEEVRAFTVEARGFLTRLRNLGIIDDPIQEEIIEKAMRMAEDEVGLKELKTITALVLLARSQDEWQRELDCIFEDDWSRLYH